ncbi:gliding motility lipoprotein GldD [Algoriphagus sp.]|uniref:gliding motility lipoprotein GldD n=1 Tax=Algoriphagus sp. TaxID=1872435 RepID=UPI00271A6D15|nr:gliding motility lipoprotein GldD [Algoriphagus sp.]MDO8965582.1 gliding motility lipoprotein GldD [Algoriphagus sp.]MDP3201622.1 gliding motility lipoprotein GldD [Algoriphagus sp.]
MKNLLILLLLLAGMTSCEKAWLPKPPGYNKIDLPKHAYTRLIGEYPYQLDFSTSSQVEPDSFNLKEKAWINLNYQDFRAKVHLTYKKIDGTNTNFEKLSNDAFKLTAKHQIKAYGIEEGVLITPNGYTAVVAELSGEVPTQFQFFVTDSTNHFLRGAVYFNTAMKNDSLAPVIEYIKIDMTHLMNSVKFVDQVATKTQRR